MDLAYLRQIATVHPSWAITVIDDVDLEHDNVAELRYDLTRKEATILVNSRYVFTEAAYLRAIVHELLELATIETWDTFHRAIEKLAQDERDRLAEIYRRQRDEAIDWKMLFFPWFTQFDIPKRRTNVLHHV